MFPWKSERVTFERFMEYCLYDPERGYYTSGRKVFGPAGDYYTSPYTHRFFAQSLGDCFASYFQRLGRPDRFDLLELGPGEGVLAREILSYLKENHPEVFGRARYSGVEVHSPLPADICGVVFSNEFFDALPVHRVRVRQGRLQEIYVEGNGEITESEGPLSDPRISEYMGMGFERVQEGWEYEVNLRLMETFEELNQRISSGVLLTVDYGYEWSEYDSVPRPEGTLLCYHRHQAHSDPYRNIGEQDITAHVNFEVMRKIGKKLRWRNEPLQTQREFMTKWKLAEGLYREEQEGLFNPERIQERLKLKELLIPGGISDTMKVLVQWIRVAEAT